MKIVVGAWSNGQLAARIWWSGTWVGAVAGVLAAGALWLVMTIADTSSLAEALAESDVLVFMAPCGLVIGATVGAAWGLVAAVVTVAVCSVPDREDLHPADVAVRVLLVVVGVHVVASMLLLRGAPGLLASTTALLGVGPLLVLVRRHVRREQLQGRARSLR